MALPTSWVSALFKKFNRRYPHKWSSAVEGDEEGMINEWAEGLYGLTGEQIKHGIDNWTEEWPPSMIEFKNCCLRKTKNEFGLDYVPEYHRQFTKTLDKSKMLSSDERDKRRKEAAKHLAKLKQALKK